MHFCLHTFAYLNEIQYINAYIFRTYLVHIIPGRLGPYSLRLNLAQYILYSILVNFSKFFDIFNYKIICEYLRFSQFLSII